MVQAKSTTIDSKKNRKYFEIDEKSVRDKIRADSANNPKWRSTTDDLSPTESSKLTSSWRLIVFRQSFRGSTFLLWAYYCSRSLAKRYDSIRSWLQNLPCGPYETQNVVWKYIYPRPNSAVRFGPIGWAFYSTYKFLSSRRSKVYLEFSSSSFR